MEQINVTNESNLMINGVEFGNVTMFCDKHCLHIYKYNHWIDTIVTGDIKSFSSSNPKVDYEVNQFLFSELE